MPKHHFLYRNAIQLANLPYLAGAQDRIGGRLSSLEQWSRLGYLHHRTELVVAIILREYFNSLC